MWWSRCASLRALGLATALLAGACTEETSTVVRVDMMFPEGEDPLDGVDSLRVRIVPEDVTDEIPDQEIDRPSDGWSELDQGIELGLVTIESAVIVIEGLDGEGDIVSAGETIAVPLKSGASGNVTAFVQRLGTSGLAPSLSRPLTAHGAAYLDGGGVLLAGGPADEPSARAWVYAIDVSQPIQIESLEKTRSLAELVPLGGVEAMIVGGAEVDATPLVWAPTTAAWSAANRSELAEGAWPSPLVALLPGGDAALAIRDRSVLRFDAEPAGVTRLAGELSRDVESPGSTLTALVGGIAVAVDAGGALAFASEGGAVDEVELAQPPLGARSGHAAAALPDGRLVLAAGALADGTLIEDVEIYDHGPQTWTLLEGLLAGQGRRGARLTPLRDGRLLLSGGEGADGELAPDAVVIDLSTEDGSIVAIPLAMPRLHHTATALPTGTVLLVGGEDAAGEPLSSVEILRPPAP
jgi:hypothetical protein